jgi:enoyl-CoA hydratase/carnithine racemase
MPKPVIAAISGTALAGGFEFALSCDLRIAEDGDYLIGFLEPHLGLVPGAGGTQRLPRTIGTPAALMHILMGDPLTPREAERKGLVTKPSVARLSIARWRLHGACRHIRRNQLLTLSVSSATPPRRLWRKALHSNEISS